MSKLYRDYFWKDGIPYGKGAITEGIETTARAFKIPMDPYRKRISIEAYANGKFEKVIYDSALFNFRHLKPAEQNAWQKETVRETADAAECLIRNQDDRIVLREYYRFENGLCRECQAFSPQGVALSTQRMLYTAFNDPVDGVVLFDMNGYPVLYKRYRVDEHTKEFTELLEESWNMETVPDWLDT